MADVNVTGKMKPAVTAAKKRHPMLEDFSATFKAFTRNKLAVVGFSITMVYFALTILDYVYPAYLGVSNIDQVTSWVFPLTANPPTGPFIIPSTAAATAPHWWFWFGTSLSRQPILPIMLAALKTDITFTLEVVLLGMLIGITVGAIAGYLGGVVDETLMRITDIFFSVPSLILAIAFVYVLGYSLNNLLAALVILWWPTYARLTRGVTLTVKSMKFIEASRASGASKIRIIFRHVIPNVLSPSFVQLSLDLGTVVLILAGLRFINLPIISPLIPELGTMINDGNSVLVGGYWWAVTIPGVFLLLFTVAVNLMGDGLRDVFDPKLRGL